MDIQNPVQEYRVAHGWSRREFAVAAGVAYSVIAHTERFNPQRIPYRLFRFLVAQEGQVSANELAHAYLQARADKGRAIIAASG